jgi:hypothetical protein
MTVSWLHKRCVGAGSREGPWTGGKVREKNGGVKEKGDWRNNLVRYPRTVIFVVAESQTSELRKASRLVLTTCSTGTFAAGRGRLQDANTTKEAAETGGGSGFGGW